MGWRQRRDGFEKPFPQVRNRGRTGWPSGPQDSCGYAWLRAVRDERQRGRQCGYDWTLVRFYLAIV